MILTRLPQSNFDCNCFTLDTAFGDYFDVALLHELIICLFLISDSCFNFVNLGHSQMCHSI